MIKIKDLQIVKNKSGGSTLTKIARESILKKSIDDLRSELRFNTIHAISDIRIGHVEELVSYWKDKNLSNRTIQNRMSVIRNALIKVGMTQAAASERLTTTALKISAPRDGTHTVPPLDEICKRIGALDTPFSVCANLQLHLGLRAREAVSCAQSLSTWIIEIERGGLIVTKGAKGGKSRRVDFSNEKRRMAAKDAIQKALDYCHKRNGFIIESSSLAGAMRAYHRAFNAVGFNGTEASHCLRYYFAEQQFIAYLEVNPLGEKEALTRLSLDLGHGDGRGRYCKQVYLQSIMKNSLPEMISFDIPQISEVE